MKFVFVILFLIFSLIYSTTQKSISSSNCVDPNESELKTMLSKGYRIYMMDYLMKGTDYYPNSQVSKELIVSEESKNANSTTYGEKKCDLVEQTKWSINHNTLCPHHFVEERREDKYPFTRFRAVCNCQDCLGVPNSDFLTYGCQPITIYKPVLIRGQCQPSGINRWSLKFESVSISCGCTLPAKFS